ncbi:hypothetical protein CROQUDRAFT_650980 [Cronartium quercuum f. sp. fusiforme G11]|uniref:Uncharacterized protein n=1 Tax=Cronartium quercuum f. sp. fusiforme G11 TaxID=708437 RepID=A0A9P6NTY1_9BASI|nr:hypothetical protein CROQUDRAFT_650980 [Cronartium quercuum f. sp. fusiforme G11]
MTGCLTNYELEDQKPLLGNTGQLYQESHKNLPVATQQSEWLWSSTFLSFKSSYVEKRRLPKIVRVVLRITVFAAFTLLTVSIGLSQIQPKGGVIKPMRAQACSAERWSSGQWVPRTDPPPTSYKSMADLLHWAGFPADFCAANDRLGHHLGYPHEGESPLEWLPLRENKFTWKGRMKLSSHKWKSGCQSDGNPEQQMTPEKLLLKLINEGSWMLIGDSLTNQWMTSLSCYLAPYVLSVPDWTQYSTPTPKKPYPNPSREDLDEHLYLNPNSTFVQSLKLPKSFNISSTPLVTALRTDLLLSSQDFFEVLKEDPLITHFNGSQHLGTLNITARPFKWGGRIYEIPVETYFKRFIDPKMNYSKFIASTGPHWTESTFPLSAPGITHVFREAMSYWSKLAIQALDSKDGQGKQIILKSSSSGHSNCVPPRLEGIVWEDVQFESHMEYNWLDIVTLNNVGKMVLESFNHPRLRFLGLDRPGALRPDTHVLVDCLHLIVGSGVIEGWTEFLYRDQVF